MSPEPKPGENSLKFCLDGNTYGMDEGRISPLKGHHKATSGYIRSEYLILRYKNLNFLYLFFSKGLPGNSAFPGTFVPGWCG